MKIKSFFTPVLVLFVSTQVSANWSGSTVVNDTERVQTIGDNVYVNLKINRDFSSLANLPIRNAPMTPFDIEKANLNKYGNCPFVGIDMTEYDKATIANGGTISKYDKKRQKHAHELVKERNRQIKECADQRIERAKADHHQSETMRLQNETLNTLTLRENELDQTNTHLFRVATTGKNIRVFGRTKELCLQDCTYTVTNTTVMFEYEGNAHIYSAQSARIQGNLMIIKKNQLIPGHASYHNHKIISMDNVTL
ncbi:hypothetical protein A9266_21695 [Vibrio tasmaniensis]|nr:hypothetical protein A9266_21695 [Vibrio tasmaniensis]